MKKTYIEDQFVGSVVQELNLVRFHQELIKLGQQDLAFEKALNEINKVRDFLSTPNNIIGNSTTKHGEIAEHVEVGVHNARKYVEGDIGDATFEGVPRTSPIDYIKGDFNYQSKFINGSNNTLKHVLNHMEKYDDYATGSNNHYAIPKDLYEEIKTVRAGDNTELSEKTKQAILDKVDKIERQSGKPFDDLVKPSSSEYAEVQQGQVHETLDKREEEISSRNDERKNDINEEHKPSFNDGIKTAAISAAFAGAIGLSIGLYKKHKEGKNLFKGDFTSEDWKELGVETGKSALGGFIAGGAIYLLTNFLNTPAPLASTFVSVGKGLNSLYSSYCDGEISSDELGELSLILASESAIVFIFSTLGQTVIPIPILGGLIGSLAGRIIAETATGKVKNEAEKLLRETDDFLDKVSEVNKKIYKEINDKFSALSSLTEAAFDVNNNESLIKYSIQLARSYGVEEKKIIKNKSDLDDFFLN